VPPLHTNLGLPAINCYNGNVFIKKKKTHAMTTIRQTPQTSSVTLEGLLAWFDGYVAALPDPDKNLIQTAFDLAKEHYPADALTT